MTDLLCGWKIDQSVPLQNVALDSFLNCHYAAARLGRHINLCATFSVTLDDPSFSAPVYARLIEGENGTHDLIWSRSKPQAA